MAFGIAGLVGFGPETEDLLEAGFEHGSGMRNPSASIAGVPIKSKF